MPDIRAESQDIDEEVRHGRPPHVATEESRKLVRSLAGYGINHDAIADELGIAPKTLRKHYRRELDNGKLTANAKVAKTLFDRITTDPKCPPGLICFWLKTQARWTEKPKEAEGDGKPVVIREMVGDGL